MDRVAVYAGTRNVYRNMITAAKSLTRHTRMDRVWFLIEDGKIPDEMGQLPDVVRVKDMSGQAWFPEGPNTRKRWSYMALLRLALPEILPEEHRVLWLDVDTIVNRDIGELFGTDLGGCYIAAAEELIRSKPPFVYFNAGVMLMDLDALRDGKYMELIRLVNGTELTFPDQDAVNLLMQTRIKKISATYNSNIWIEEVPDPAVTHYAADRHYWIRDGWKEAERQEWRVKDAD